jgi:predicted alpha/beta-fold hydrolase
MHERDTRAWLRETHRQLKDLLPGNARSKALLTEDLTTPDGKSIDVLGRFGLKGQTLDSIFTNCDGLQHTAQASGGDHPSTDGPPIWPDFTDVWVPINENLSLAGRLGLARRDGVVRDADCIVLLPGMLGHNQIMRTRDLARALLDEGFHVLPVELRGHGQTDVRYPQVNYGCGVYEAGDLMAVSEWLMAQPHVRRTGLVGFCWGANEALLAAWEDSRSEDHPSVNARLRPHLRRPTKLRHFEAGVIAFSPVLRFEEIMDSMVIPQSSLEHPVLASLQSTILARMLRKNRPNPSGCLRHFIFSEYAGTEIGYPNSVDDAMQYLRLLPFRGMSDGNKLADVRVPTLIVQGANDPLASAQDVADLMSTIDNPNVAAIILPGGGHVGFAAYARRYFYSLILNYFDPMHGPSVTTRCSDQEGKAVTMD